MASKRPDDNTGNNKPQGSSPVEDAPLLIGHGSKQGKNRKGGSKWHFGAARISGRRTGAAKRGADKSRPEFTPPAEAESLSELELLTGYEAAKNETFGLLEEIAQKKVVPQEPLRSVSAELSNRLEVTSPATIMSLINALAPVDEYLPRHSVNVSLLNGLFGFWMGLPKKEIDNLVLIGLLHDCGKALIPPKVLMAPRKLTIVEFEVIKMHTVNSYDLLDEFPEPLRNAARSHHERVCGYGYPDFLSDEEIPYESRITAISDIYDAMVSQRAYKKALSPFKILKILTEMRDTDLDSWLVDVFIDHMPLELLRKPVVMSDGTFGIVQSFDPEDPEFPVIEIAGQPVKCNEGLYCVSMYTED